MTARAGPLCSGSGFGVPVPNKTTLRFCPEAAPASRARNGSERCLIRGIPVNLRFGRLMALHLVLFRLNPVSVGACLRLHGGKGEAESECQYHVAHVELS